jgi:hypothetical protein
MPAKKKPGTSAQRPAVNAVNAALTSPYNTLIPLGDATGLWVKHPTAHTTFRVEVGSEKYFTVMQELVELGLGVRLRREFAEFAAKNDRWNAAFAALEQHLADKEILIEGTPIQSN